MTARNKNIPALRFKGFEGEWTKSRLGDISNIITGSTPSTTVSEYYDGDRLFVSPADIQENRYVSQTKTTITELGFKQGRKISKGSILFVCIGSTIGKVGQATEDCITNQQINSLVGNKNTSNDFLYGLLEKNGKKIKLLAGVQAVPQINKTDFSNFKYYIPSLPEQQKIASFLSAIDEKIRHLTRRKELLEQYKKGVMQQLFSGKLRFKDNKGKAYPKWEEKKFGDVFEITSSKRVFQDEWTTFGVPFYRAREIVKLCNEGFVDNELFISEEMFTSYQSKYGAPSENDILVTGVGTLGKTYIVKAKDRFYFKDGNIIWFKNSRNVNSKYVNHLFQTKIILEQISNNASITTVGTYTIDSAKKTKFPCPSIEEQNKIASFLSSIDTKLESVAAQIEGTKGYKKGLLQKMFV